MRIFYFYFLSFFMRPSIKAPRVVNLSVPIDVLVLFHVVGIVGSNELSVMSLELSCHSRVAISTLT